MEQWMIVSNLGADDYVTFYADDFVAHVSLYVLEFVWLVLIAAFVVVPYTFVSHTKDAEGRACSVAHVLYALWCGRRNNSAPKL